MEAKVFFGFCVLFVLFFENGSVTGQQQSPLASLAAAALNQYSEYVKLKSLDKSLSNLNFFQYSGYSGLLDY